MTTGYCQGRVEGPKEGTGGTREYHPISTGNIPEVAGRTGLGIVIGEDMLSKQEVPLRQSCQRRNLPDQRPCLGAAAVLHN